MSGESLARLLSDSQFMPHGMCYLWRPGLLAVHVTADAIIVLAYVAIPLTLLHWVRKRTDLRFQWVFVCFAVFIVSCGATHLMDIWTIWHPAYWLSGAVKAITAVASAATAILVIEAMPRALRLPSPSNLQSAIDALGHEIDQRTLVEKSLRAANDTLEARVRERTVQLEELNRTLLQDNARFAAAADAAGMGFWTFDVASNELQWDERMFRLYGRSSDCTPASEIRANSLHPDDRDKCAEEARKALLGFSAYDVEYRIVRPNGAVRNVRSVARITRDARGGATQMIGVSFDITDLKRADDRFRLAIEAAPTGMLLMSGTGSIVLVNAEIETLFGYPRAELLGRQIEMLVPERFRTHHPEFRAKFFSAPVARPMGAGRDLYGLRKDGSEVPIEIGLTPLHTFEGDFVLSSIVDLSMRREMEQMRTDFVSTVSHELRTPLTSINGSLGLLQAGAMGALCEEAAAMVEIAYKNSGRLVRIINDILDIGKLEAGELAMQRISVPLSDLLRQSVEVNSSYAEKYSVHFVLDEQCAEGHVLADPDRLMQVVTNLLSNAAKFSPPGESVRIRVLRKPGTMRVEVEDSGAGIPEAFKNRIFEKFAQADSSASRNFEGTGLGLSIARKLIEAMDGSIGFSSLLGHGTTFHFELPRSEADSTVRQAPSPAPGDQRGVGSGT